VEKVMEDNYKRAEAILQENRSLLDALAATLEEKEVLSAEEVKSLLKKT
jgi:ATP-dependent Zn protease